MLNQLPDCKLFAKYFFNCFLLTIPILFWNLALSNKLPKAFQPEIFWNNIPPFLTYGENISRTVVFLLTLLMPLGISTPIQRKGFALYAGGTVVYFASWVMLIYFPYNEWSNRVGGFMAPACTPVLWLLGIGLIADSFYFKLPFRRWFFISAAIIFLAFHNVHAYIIYLRTHPSI